MLSTGEIEPRRKTRKIRILEGASLIFMVTTELLMALYIVLSAELQQKKRKDSAHPCCHRFHVHRYASVAEVHEQTARHCVLLLKVKRLGGLL